MAFISMENKPEKSKKEDDPCCTHDEPKYPWGLGIYFDEDSLTKLGMAQDDFKVGDTFPMTVMVRVTGTSQRETDEGTRESVDLQITEIEKPTTEGGRAKRMFSSMKGDDD